MGARENEVHIALGFALRGEELVIGGHADFGRDGSDRSEPGEVGNSAEGAIGEADGGGVLAQVEGDLGHAHIGGNGDLTSSSAAGKSCVSVEAGYHPDQAAAVHQSAVGHEDRVLFRLRDGVSPSLCFNIPLQTFKAYHQFAKNLVDAVRCRNRSG